MWHGSAVYLEPVRGMDLELMQCGGGVAACRTVKCDEWFVVPAGGLDGPLFEDLVILQDEHYELACEHLQSTY